MHRNYGNFSLLNEVCMRNDRQVLKRFAARLRAARITAGFDTAEGCARALGLEPHTYRSYEAANRQPPLSTLSRMCELLGVSPNDLLQPSSGRRRSGPLGDSAAA